MRLRAEPSRKPARSPRPARRALLLAAAVSLTCLLAVAFAGCGAKPAPSDSGVQGHVSIGPVSPVEQPGVTNDKPYAATLRITLASGGNVVSETMSAADGSYKVALAPGSYVLEPVAGSPLPTAQPQAFTVVAHSFTTVDVSYDSGIR
jgi:hypothetical protein